MVNNHYSRRDFLKFAGISCLLSPITSCATAHARIYDESNLSLALVPQTKLNSEILNLEELIEIHVQKLTLNGLISDDEKLACCVYDFQSKEKLVGINDYELFQCASMVKPFVALAYFHKVYENKLKYTPKIKKKISLMIERSSNDATNQIMQLLGGPKKIEKLLKINYSKICSQMQIVEGIPKGGKTYRNKASAKDYTNFLSALWNGNLPFSDEIKKNMANTGKSRVYKGTNIPDGIQVYNKTGTTSRLCGDMAIFNALGLDGKRRAYTFVAIIEKDNNAKNYLAWKEEKSSIIRGVSELVYAAMKSRHNLI